VSPEDNAIEIELQNGASRGENSSSDSFTMKGKRTINSIENELKALGKPDKGETFGEAFIH
jgi:hypothetical protein